MHPHTHVTRLSVWLTTSRARVAGALEPLVHLGTQLLLCSLCAAGIVEVGHLPRVRRQVVVLHKINVVKVDLFLGWCCSRPDQVQFKMQCGNVHARELCVSQKQ